MSNFIDAEGHFDHVGQKLIGTTSPVVVNGDRASALWLLLSDQKQTDLLFWGPSFCVVAGKEGEQFGATASLVNHFVGIWVPPFCDRISFDILARGTGDVTFGSSYVISVNSEGLGPVWYPGSQTDNLISVTGTLAGVPLFQKIDFEKEAGVDVRCVVVRFLRSQQNIT